MKVNPANCDGPGSYNHGGGYITDYPVAASCSGPQDIAFDTSGTVWLACQGSNILVGQTLTGSVYVTLGSGSGTGTGQFGALNPMGMFVTTGIPASIINSR